jgi:hypothetical protein
LIAIRIFKLLPVSRHFGVDLLSWVVASTQIAPLVHLNHTNDNAPFPTKRSPAANNTTDNYSWNWFPDTIYQGLDFSLTALLRLGPHWQIASDVSVAVSFWFTYNRPTDVLGPTRSLLIRVFLYSIGTH